MNNETKEKRRPGRRPMTAQEKEQAAQVRAIEKAKAESLHPDFILQYQGLDIDMGTLAEAAKTDFHTTRKRTRITDLKLYVKPEERKVYYVVNGKHTGDISF